MIINIHDKFIGSEIMARGVWEAGEISLILRLADFLVRQNGSILVYDVGANIGHHSLALATTYKSKISIRAFEAQPLVFQMLCGTMALNNLQNVNCECALVSDSNETSISVRLPDYNVANNFGGFEFSAAKYSDNDDMKLDTKNATVRCISIDSFEEKVDLIKIDVEGMEELVLNGAASTISSSRPFCYVETKKTGLEPIRDFFHRAQYKLFTHGDNVLAIPKEWLRDISFLEYFFKSDLPSKSQQSCIIIPIIEG
jgi:FkbM family methyltransferase